MIAIFKRELKSYFNTMTGWVFIAFMLVATGIYTFIYNFYYGVPYFAYTLCSVEFLYMVFIPILSMRSMAEERKVKTDQLLLTSPVSITKIVLGKYFAMSSVLLISLLPFLPLTLIFVAGGNGSFIIDYSTMLAFFLLGNVYIAIGMLVSSLTESQIIAAVGTFVALVLLRLWPSLLSFVPVTAEANAIALFILIILICTILFYMTKNSFLALVLAFIGMVAVGVGYAMNGDWLSGGFISVLGQFNLSDVLLNFGSYYVFDVNGLILYVSIIGLMILITVQLMQRKRWN